MEFPQDRLYKNQLKNAQKETKEFFEENPQYKEYILKL